ncbi:MAG: DNA polymerase [Rectinemataceae bacterium]
MRAESSVVHVNVVGFMAAVEALADPERRGKAFVVGFPGAGRALVLDASRVAIKEGIRIGMGLDAARARVGGLSVLPPSFDAYRRANALVEKVCSRYAPLVENDSGGHFYLDLGGTRRLFGEYIDSAARIKNEIRSTVGLEPTVGLARNKLVAKVGTRSLRPDGLALVREGDEAAFLAPQDVELLPGVGPKLLRLLRAVGMREIRELAEVGDDECRALFGKGGPALRDAARGLDFGEVAGGRLAERIIARELRFESDVLDAFEIRAGLVRLVEEVGLELRTAAFVAGRLSLRVTYTDGFEASASRSCELPLSGEAELLRTADGLLSRAGERRVRVRALFFALSDLSPSSPQLDLFAPPELSKTDGLQRAVDAARTRFGSDKLGLCAALGKAAYSRV